MFEEFLAKSLKIQFFFFSVFSFAADVLRLRLFKTDKKVYNSQKEKKDMADRNVEILIEGMACSHCSGRVESALNALNGVEAKVDLEKKTAFVKAAADVSDEKLKETVTGAGYKVVSVK